MRYAIYFVPHADSEVFRKASQFIGYDCVRRRNPPFPDLRGVDAEELARLTREPARYGFHATIKAPFRLAAEQTEDRLVAAVERFCKSEPPVQALRLAPGLLKTFAALLPLEGNAELSGLAQRCVEYLDGFRAPMNADERARRIGSGLSARQAALLEQWGYPNVGELYRFHMTLTGPLPPADRERWLRAAAGHFGDAPIDLSVDTLCLCLQPGPEERFYVAGRWPLAASSRKDASAEAASSG